MISPLATFERAGHDALMRGLEPCGTGDDSRGEAPAEVDWAAIHAELNDALSAARIVTVGFDFDFQGRSPRPRPARDEPGRAYLHDGWIITILLAQPLAQFGQGFLQEGGKDAYQAFKRMLGRVKLAPGKGAAASGSAVRLREEGGPSVEVRETIGERALAALQDVEWTSFESNDVLVWNSRTGRWTKA